MVSCSGGYFFGEVGVGVVTETFQDPLSQLCICNHQCHCQSIFLALHTQQKHKSWANTPFPVTAQTMDTVPGCSRPQSQTRPSEAVRTMDMNLTTHGRAGHSQQYGPQWQHAPWSSTRIQASTQTKDIHMSSSGNMDHRYQCRPWLQ